MKGLLSDLQLPGLVFGDDTRRRAVALRYLIGALVLVAAEFIYRALSAVTEPLPPFIVFYPAVLLIAILCGVGPALCALALCLAVGVARHANPVALTIFVGMNLVTCAVLLKLHRAQRNEAAARRELQTLLQKAQAEREWFALVLSSINEEVYFTDPQQRYRYVNTAVIAEFAHGAIEDVPVAGILSQLEVLRPDGTPRPIAEAPPLRALQGEVIRDEEQLVRIPRTGELRHRQVSSAPVRDADGKIIGSVSVARDITERKRVEAALREADRRKTVFLSTLSHELRNPMAPIRAAARVLESSAATAAEIARARAIIVRQVAHMVSLLDDLLDVSRFTRGDLSLRKEAVPLRRVFDAAVEATAPLIAARGHRLHVDIAPQDAIVHVDPVRFTQVISNLLGNAAKYTDEGGEVTLNCRIDADAVRIAVRDSGMGLTADARERIFELFVQVEPGQARAQGGLGIGLALVRAIVELHGGRVHAHSAGLGEGSTFTIELPLSVLVDTAPMQEVEVTTPAPASPARRVLVADDNLDGARSLAMVLQILGHEVHVVHDGPAAIAASEELLPEVVVLDIGMPGMTGYEVARHIRAQPWGATMLLIALTGWGQEADKQEARAAGFDHHFTKPVEPSTLEQAFERPTLNS